ncbi:MAG TPA: hypothetical protein PKL82_04385 [Anaerolineaceae bacterium]|jgi:hypothetical protein|nr:hypothetical protein [Anaerolineaceae bacterium]NMD26527.1 hypothetical protein [Chloroflexota bacterium]HOA21709.1 hypothetical protein [Anaerolineaceae bacterium]HOG77137.1 hypothetical protein [Anaerolineaceae bacterium]
MANALVLIGKKLIADTSSAEIRRIEDILKHEKISYRLQTQRTRGALGSYIDARSYAASNIALYKGSQQPSFVYAIYVRPKDFKRAQALIAQS